MSLQNKIVRYIEKKCPIEYSGKTVLITGANSGVGYATAEAFLYVGAKLIMACRNKQKAEEAKVKLQGEFPKAKITILRLDLASFTSIDAFVADVKKQKLDIDCWVNNAGVFRQPNKTTADGLELVMGTNYIGTYYLTEQILPYLHTLAHKVYYLNTVSFVYKYAKLDYDDFYCAKKYGNFKVYARSKLALTKYCQYLAKKEGDSNIKVYGIHPGISITPIATKAYKRLGKVGYWFRFLFNSTAKAGLAPLYIVAHDLPVGAIVGPKCLGGIRGYPHNNKIYKKALTEWDKLIDFTQKEIDKIKKK